MTIDVRERPEQRPIRVLVVDDHVMVAECLAVALAREPGFAVVGTVGTLAAAREAVIALRPDVVLLDDRLPDGAGVADIARLRELWPGARVVMLTAEADDALLVQATEAGCSGFLTHASGLQELVTAVRSAAAGDVLVSPALLARLLAHLHRAEPSGRPSLTPRELDVLALIAEGLGNAEMARRLGVSVNTVRNHVQSLLGKLGAHSKLEVLAIAVREGLVPAGA